MEIIDPPPCNGGRQPTAHWIEVVKTLKEQYPDRYGKVGNYSNGVGTQIRQGRYPAFIPADVSDKADYMDRHWRVTTRRTSDGRNDLYIKWIGSNCVCRYCG